MPWSDRFWTCGEVTDLSDINACEAHPSFEFAGSSYEGRTDSEFVNIC